MKKQLLLFAMMLLPLVASAQSVEIDGIYYNLVSKIQEAEVTSNPNKYTGSVVIPEKVTYESVEYSVTSIGSGAFGGCSGLTSITIPNSVTTIGEYNQEIKGETNVEIIPVIAWQTADFMYSMFRWAEMHIVKYDHRSVTKSLPVSLPKIVLVTNETPN